MFKTRLISGIVLIAVALFIIITGGNISLIAFGVLSLIGMYELFRIEKIETNVISFPAYIASVIYYINLKFSFIDDVLLILIITLICIFVIFVLKYPEYTFNQVILIFVGLIYVPIMMSMLYKVRMLPNGIWLVWLIFIGAWGCDTFAYCSGMLFGKNKLCPKLSPKKSIEGAVGGVIGAILLGVIYSVMVIRITGETTSYMWKFAFITFIASIVSQFGDLTASGIKRNYNIKDYGNIIPGHGGILDRFDSIILVSPVVYYLLIALI